MSDHLIIFDTTLRDGEQSPGASMTREEKMRIAKQLERLRVDVIEAGFPASSNGDWEAVHDIARAIRDSVVCGLARANENDVRRCGEAIKPAVAGRVHTFIAIVADPHADEAARWPRTRWSSRQSRRSAGRATTRRTSSSRRRTQGARSPTSCAGSSRR